MKQITLILFLFTLFLSCNFKGKMLMQFKLESKESISETISIYKYNYEIHRNKSLIEEGEIKLTKEKYYHFIPSTNFNKTLHVCSYYKLITDTQLCKIIKVPNEDSINKKPILILNQKDSILNCYTRIVSFCTSEN